MSSTLEKYDNDSYTKFTSKSEFDKALFTLKGLIEGALIDGEINPDEIMELRNWLGINRDLEKYKPFDEIIASIDDILADGVITDEEKDDLLWLASSFSENGKYYDLITRSIQNLQGVCYGLIADNMLTEPEILSFSEWIEENSFLDGTYPYDEIKALIKKNEELKV